MARSKYWDNTLQYSQPAAEDLIRKAKQSAERAAKRGKVYHPVVIEGRTIAQSWWGKAWCANIEQYADYASRIERGKRYVRTGAVVDLVIQKGKVSARVQGRRSAPYRIDINISPLKEADCEWIIEQCGSRIDSLEQLANGSFPEDLQDIFLGERGLFPREREISFTCSCPDWAIMCKHVAAVLYGIGARLDENPFLFFELRGIDAERLIDIAIKDHVKVMLEHANLPLSDRVMDDSVIGTLFGL